MARKNMPKTNGIIPQKSNKKTNANVSGQTSIVIQSGGRSSCWADAFSCSKVAGCITNDALTILAVNSLISNWIVANPIPTTNVLGSAVNSMTSTVNWFADTAPIINTNDLSNVWLLITSTINGVADSVDITAAVQAELSWATDSVINTIAWNAIALHTAVDGTPVTINETITSTALYETASDTWVSYTDESGTVNNIKTGYYEVITPVANTAYTVTHGLNSTRIIVAAYDDATGEQVDIEVSNRTATTVDITSTTTDDLEIVIKR